MSEVLFYQLSKFPLERALPTLLEKCLERDWVVTVQFATEERCDAIDAYLWTYSEDGFLPHGTKKEGHPEYQPIYLTTESDNPNEAIVRFLVDRAPLPDPAQYQRVVYMFDGNDQDALQEARKRWVEVKDTGHDLTYWAQTDSGGWDRKA
ncbi:DNA polymerase III subunit chi [Pseudovibrio axinellae]|uniref:DNA polymerase III subunit chi n=1 Tax=Pseudovibrio axinellae TaxID=989403 RepID=A0A165ULD8_9HYPH|nr:DNA polymerase III subunit chi [Pseudovibrio axinellae]KZL12507.1 DNA polymerase III subunit chi [Pseudovibrio axinellae]SEP69245.1 DNA polymerase III, chi subunit [Pseudovibrio axinellae]